MWSRNDYELFSCSSNTVRIRFVDAIQVPHQYIRIYDANIHFLEFKVNVFIASIGYILILVLKYFSIAQQLKFKKICVLTSVDQKMGQRSFILVHTHQSHYHFSYYSISELPTIFLLSMKGVFYVVLRAGLSKRNCQSPPPQTYQRHYAMA